MKIFKLINYNIETDSMNDGSYIPLPPIVYGDVLPVGYEDITSMITWDASNHLDWSRRRDEISTLFYAEAGAQLQNFANMSAAKKLLACKYFLIPYNIRLQIISEETDMEHWAELLQYTKESRQTCVEAMRKHVGQYIRTGDLTLAQTQAFFKDVRVHIQLFNDTNAPDFKQWLTNEVGSPYENDGFAQKSYFSSGLLAELLDIYNGNY